MTSFTAGHTSSPSTQNHVQLIAAGRVIGTNIYDKDGEKIGTIDDIMVGRRDGHVAYAVMSFGGFLGIGEKFHPLPWDALDYDGQLGGYRVGAAGENFRDAPSYSREGLEDEHWREATDRYYDDSANSAWLERRHVTGIGAQHTTPGTRR